MSYDPNSNNAMFSRVMQRLDTQDETLKQILAEVRKTNGRVTSLESTRTASRAQVATISIIVSGAFGLGAWLVKLYLSK